MLKLENPVKERTLANILAFLSDDERASVARRLVRLSQAFDRQDKFDEEVAAALDRILDAPTSTVRPLAAQIRKRIREIANAR